MFLGWLCVVWCGFVIVQYSTEVQLLSFVRSTGGKRQQASLVEHIKLKRCTVPP